MRLIDADKLEIDICYAKNLNKVESIYDYSYSEKQIQNAPTVKAIPIDYILKWACGFIDPNSQGYRMAMELVHDWRKENA